ncbi:hypothetical protein ACHHYP_17345 [Achlya hypogyna]|uniref:PH domain-containing protein n=1 Tax=Achlya hypogyna TaxID=1202772 RepID=A0A1V9Y4Q9_ACHHY|nr:hypothetical protein ACHHYP_17345 [Achlya hypogyna]
MSNWEGWVYKHGGLFPSWKKVYLVVRGRSLQYLDKEPSNPRAKEKAKATLSAVQRDASVKNGLTITGADGKHARIYTKSSEEITSCLNALNAVLRPEPKPRPSLDRPPMALHSGWLGMDGKGPKKWYFVLNGPDLSNYDRVGGAEIGRGRLADVTPTDRPASFVFVFTNGRTLPVAAESAGDASAWIHAVCMALHKPPPSRASLDAPVYGRASSRELEQPVVRAAPRSEPAPVRAPATAPPRSEPVPIRAPVAVPPRGETAVSRPPVAAVVEAPVAAPPRSAPVAVATPVAPTPVPAPPQSEPTPTFSLPPPVFKVETKRKFAPAAPPKPPMAKPPRAPAPVAEAHFANNAAEVWQMTDPSLVQAWVEHGKAAPVAATPVPPPQQTQKLQSFLDKYMRPEDTAAQTTQTSL